MLRSKQQSSAAMTLTKEGSRLLLNDHWGKNKKKEKEGKKERARFGQRESGSGFAHWRGSAWLLACLPGCLSVWVMWDWFILVHHLAHQSFTWDWVSKDDKSESLMWSKVSGSDSVWVNTKDLLFPFFFTPPHTHIHPQAPPSTPPPLSPAPSFCLLLSFPITRPPLTPFPEIYEGNVWIWLALWTRCQTTSETLCWGSRLHGDVFLLSLSVPSLLALLLFLLRRCCEWPLIDRFLSFSMHLTELKKKQKKTLPKVHSGVILNHVISWVTTVLQPAWVGRDVWRWPTDSSNQERNAEKMWEKKGVRESKWKDEHGKSGVSTWPFEFKHMSDVVKTSQKHRGRGNAGTHWRGASLGKPDKSQWATWNYSQLP